MKNDWLSRVLTEIRRNDAGASHLALGAMLVVTILYATTMI
jgi:hypothetical protein